MSGKAIQIAAARLCRTSCTNATQAVLSSVGCCLDVLAPPVAQGSVVRKSWFIQHPDDLRFQHRIS